MRKIWQCFGYRQRHFFSPYARSQSLVLRSKVWQRFLLACGGMCFDIWKLPNVSSNRHWNEELLWNFWSQHPSTRDTWLFEGNGRSQPRSNHLFTKNLLMCCSQHHLITSSLSLSRDQRDRSPGQMIVCMTCCFCASLQTRRVSSDLLRWNVQIADSLSQTHPPSGKTLSRGCCEQSRYRLYAILACRPVYWWGSNS